MTAHTDFDGTPVDKHALKASGTIGDDRLNTALAIGDEVVIVATARVTAVQHATNADGDLVRTHKLGFSGAYIADALDAADLLHSLRADRAAALDELLGTSTLFPADGIDENDAGPEIPDDLSGLLDPFGAHPGLDDPDDDEVA